MKAFLTALGLAAFLALPATAQSYRAQGDITVTPVPGGFRVADGGGMGARGMWCAAADYAQRVSGGAATTRIYVADETRRGPVTFTLDPAGLTPSSVLILGNSIRRAGANLSLAHALSFCADFRLRTR